MEELKYVEEEDPLPGACPVRRTGYDGLQAVGDIPDNAAGAGDRGAAG